MSFSRLVLWEFQLQAIISTMSGQGSLIDVGTGNGKTLCMIIPCLLSIKTISIIISPLKRLPTNSMGLNCEHIEFDMRKFENLSIGR